jgi:L-asparaginase
MPITQPTQGLRKLVGGLGFAFCVASALRAAPAGVAVVRAAPWSPGDVARDGAGEFEVLMCAARLQQEHRAAGIVGVGDRHGLFTFGAERALRVIALRGVPVVKLASGGDVASDPDQLFLDANGLSEAEASAVLARCLERHGRPPMAVDPEHPTANELAAIRAHLQPFREAFVLAAAPQLAVK